MPRPEGSMQLSKFDLKGSFRFSVCHWFLNGTLLRKFVNNPANPQILNCSMRDLWTCFHYPLVCSFSKYRNPMMLYLSCFLALMVARTLHFLGQRREKTQRTPLHPSRFSCGYESSVNSGRLSVKILVENRTVIGNLKDYVQLPLSRLNFKIRKSKHKFNIYSPYDSRWWVLHRRTSPVQRS